MPSFAITQNVERDTRKRRCTAILIRYLPSSGNKGQGLRQIPPPDQTRWIQWVDATLARSLSAGVSKAKLVCEKIHGMTEKFVLREAVHDVITETAYKRQKHPFLSPPATLNPKERLSALVNDTLRGPVLASIPFFDQKKVVALLDSLHTMDEGQPTSRCRAPARI